MWTVAIGSTLSPLLADTDATDETDDDTSFLSLSSLSIKAFLSNSLQYLFDPLALPSLLAVEEVKRESSTEGDRDEEGGRRVSCIMSMEGTGRRC